MEARPTTDPTQAPDDWDWVGYAVDRDGGATLTAALDSLLRDADLGALGAAIEAYGLEMVPEQVLRGLVDSGKLYGDEAAAYAEERRILDEDRRASPTVHAISVAVLADEFTRLGLTEGGR